MEFERLQPVALVRDLPSEGLSAGDVGAVVEIYGADAVEVEFVTASGRTSALVTLRASDLRPVGGLAAWVLAEVESEERWGEAFAASQSELAELADEALAEHRAGRSRPSIQSPLEAPIARDAGGFSA